jgi:mannose-6-phosphate isomerase class I
MTYSGEIMNVLKQTEINIGDYVFVNPGTIHALTLGCLVYEIEEGNDITYRLYDYDRVDERKNKRELHIEKAMVAADISLASTPRRYENGQEIIETTFATKKFEQVRNYQNQTGTLESVTVLAGETSIDAINIMPGMTILLEPGEILKDVFIEQCIIAHMR